MPPGRWGCSTGSAREASVPMTEIRIDLQSDTQTRPTPGMRQAMAEAAVGDEQRNEDPSTNRLLAMVKELFGKEDAVFLPSRSEEHTSELQSLMRTSYAVFCLKKKNNAQVTSTK